MSILMKLDKRKVSELSNQYSLLIPELNQVLNAYNEMKIGELDTETLKDIINSPEEIVFVKITKGEPLTIMGIAVDKIKAMDIIVKPNGYHAFIESIKVLKSKPNWQYYLGMIEIDDNVLKLSKRTIESIESLSSTYAETETEKLIYNFANNFLSLAKDTFGEHYGGCDIGKMISEIIFHRNDASGKSWEIIPEKIKEVSRWTIDSRVL